MLVCCLRLLGERIGWHWGFGAAGIGMLFGVIQFVYFRSQLGTAGLNPNEMQKGAEALCDFGPSLRFYFLLQWSSQEFLGFGVLIQYFLPNVFVTF